MATVVNNPSVPASERTVIERSDDSAGWAVAVIILLAVVAVGAFVWLRYARAPAAPASSGGANINVTLPANELPGAGTGAPPAGENTTPPAQ